MDQHQYLSVVDKLLPLTDDDRARVLGQCVRQCVLTKGQASAVMIMLICEDSGLPIVWADADDSVT